MLITVPEGKYQVKISAAGTTAEKNVVINRNSESSLDFSDVEFAKPKTGKVFFSISPTKAKLYVDGELTDVSESVELTYGLHQLICKAEGYTSITQYLNVGQPSAGIDITLEEIKDKEEDSDSTDSGNENASGSTENGGSTENSGNSGGADNGGNNGNNGNNGSSEGGSGGGSTGSENGNTNGSTGTENGGSSTENGNSGSTDNGGNTGGEDQTLTEPIDITSTYYKVYVDSPESVEIYVDGSYVGIAPCSFKKTAGYHIVTLSKSGYITRSYTISVDSDDKDISFSFADLVKEP